MKTEKINKDFIGVVLTDNGILKYGEKKIETLPISHKLAEMFENPNQTVLDMQQHFVCSFPNKRSFNYCLPYSYDTSYINGVLYLEMMSFQEYSDKLKEKRDELAKNNTSNIKDAIAKYADGLKKKFLETAYRYIEAYNYDLVRQQISSDENIKMYSSENIGWTYFEYKISSDIVFTLNTNFGYGSASYFFANLRWKGIDILPYSHAVRYYKANMRDLIRYTRLYYPDRDNWVNALKFVVEISNSAMTDEKSFVQKWIIAEVNEMMKGLQCIKQDSKSYIERFSEQSRESEYITVRNITNDEKIRYAAYPEEMGIVFKAEKITGALTLLDKLAQLPNVYPAVTDRIEEIKIMNREILPEIEHHIEHIGEDISRLERKLNLINVGIEELDKQIAPHITIIDQLCEKAEIQDPKRDKYYIRRDVELEYRNSSLEYKELIDNKYKILEKKYTVNKEIWERKQFVLQLNECSKQIIEAKIIA